MDAKRTTPRYIVIKMPKFKDKEKILKAEREKQLPTGQFPLDCQLISQKKTAVQKGLARNIQSDEEQGPTAKIALPSKDTTQNGRANKELPRQEKINGVHHHQAIII